MMAVCQMTGIDRRPAGATPFRRPQPAQPVVELAAAFEQPFVDLCERLAVQNTCTHTLQPRAVKLINMGKQILSQRSARRSLCGRL